MWDLSRFLYTARPVPGAADTAVKATGKLPCPQGAWER